MPKLFTFTWYSRFGWPSTIIALTQIDIRICNVIFKAAEKSFKPSFVQGEGLPPPIFVLFML